MSAKLSTRELFVDNVLKNKFVWLLAFANFFAYITRYSMLDWGPTYLRDVKGGHRHWRRIGHFGQRVWGNSLNHLPRLDIRRVGRPPRPASRCSA